MRRTRTGPIAAGPYLPCLSRGFGRQASERRARNMAPALVDDLNPEPRYRRGCKRAVMDRNRLTEDHQEAPRAGGAGMAPAERQVIVICEECGKKYSVALSRIRGSAAGFTCRSCGHRIVVAKPPELPVQAARLPIGLP